MAVLSIFLLRFTVLHLLCLLGSVYPACIDDNEALRAATGGLLSNCSYTQYCDLPFTRDFQNYCPFSCGACAQTTRIPTFFFCIYDMTISDCDLRKFVDGAYPRCQKIELGACEKYDLAISKQSTPTSVFLRSSLEKDFKTVSYSLHQTSDCKGLVYGFELGDSIPFNECTLLQVSDSFQISWVSIHHDCVINNGVWNCSDDDPTLTNVQAEDFDPQTFTPNPNPTSLLLQTGGGPYSIWREINAVKSFDELTDSNIAGEGVLVRKVPSSSTIFTNAQLVYTFNLTRGLYYLCIRESLIFEETGLTRGSILVPPSSDITAPPSLEVRFAFNYTDYNFGWQTDVASYYVAQDSVVTFRIGAEASGAALDAFVLLPDIIPPDPELLDGLLLPCVDYGTEGSCSLGECLWAENVCVDPDIDILCGLLEEKVCRGNSRCVFDEYLGVCQPAGECECASDGLSGGVQTGVHGCVSLAQNSASFDYDATALAQKGLSIQPNDRCYVKGGSASRCPGALSSVKNPLAAHRPCFTWGCTALTVEATDPSKKESAKLVAGIYLRELDFLFQQNVYPVYRTYQWASPIGFSHGFNGQPNNSAQASIGPISLMADYQIKQANKEASALDVSNYFYFVTNIYRDTFIQPVGFQFIAPWTAARISQADQNLTLTCVLPPCPGVVPTVSNITSGRFSLAVRVLTSIYSSYAFTVTGEVVCTPNATFASIISTPITTNGSRNIISDLFAFVVYECNVLISSSQCMPRSTAFTVQLLPTVPEQILLVEKKNSTATQLVVAWTQGAEGYNGPMRRYELGYILASRYSGPNSTFTYLNSSTIVSEMTVSGLSPYTMYSVRVRGVNSVGPAIWSLVANLTTSEAPPLSGGWNISVSRTGERAVTVLWSPPPLDLLRGIPSYYVIVYSTNSTSASRATEIVGNVTVSHLQGHATQQASITIPSASVSYQVAVCVGNGAGLSPATQWYAVPSYSEASSSSSSSSSDSIPIIASLVSFFVILIILVVAVLVFRQRKREQRLRLSWASQLETPQHLDFSLLSELEIPRENVIMRQELGEGQFGSVFEGLLTATPVVANLASLDHEPDTSLPVAIKMLKQQSDPSDKATFAEEAVRMKDLNHPHVVKLLAVCFASEPNFILVELMTKGDLKKYLRGARPTEVRDAMLTPRAQLGMALQVCSGMCYLAEKKFVHRDIAARNILINDKDVLKIGDFGMARNVHFNDYYRKRGKGMMPLRWMPGESFMEGIFNAQTEVWMYGVLLWEIFSFGNIPWPACTDETVIQNVRNDVKMEKPFGCPEIIYDIMVSTWSRDPQARPTIHQLYDRIQSLQTSPPRKFPEFDVAGALPGSRTGSVRKNPSSQNNAMTPRGPPSSSNPYRELNGQHQSSKNTQGPNKPRKVWEEPPRNAVHWSSGHFENPAFKGNTPHDPATEDSEADSYL